MKSRDKKRTKPKRTPAAFPTTAERREHVEQQFNRSIVEEMRTTMSISVYALNRFRRAVATLLLLAFLAGHNG